MEEDLVKFCVFPSSSVKIITNPVRIPLDSNSSGLCHVITMEVEVRAITVTLVGGPLGARYIEDMYQYIGHVQCA